MNYVTYYSSLKQVLYVHASAFVRLPLHDGDHSPRKRSKSRKVSSPSRPGLDSNHARPWAVGSTICKLNQEVFRSIVTAKLTHASQAWSGFCTTSDINNLDRFLARCKRHNYCSHTMPSIGKHKASPNNLTMHDQSLFRTVGIVCRPMYLFSSKITHKTSSQKDSKAQRHLQLSATKKCLEQILATTHNMTEVKHNKNPSLMNSGPERTT